MTKARETKTRMTIMKTKTWKTETILKTMTLKRRTNIKTKMKTMMKTKDNNDNVTGEGGNAEDDKHEDEHDQKDGGEVKEEKMGTEDVDEESSCSEDDLDKSMQIVMEDGV